jgi:hypothetical protein
MINRRVPNVPSKVTSRDTSGKKDAALFQFTLFCPVDPLTGRFLNVGAGENVLYTDVTWSTFMHFLRYLGRHDGDISHRHTLEIIIRMNAALKIQTMKKSLIM